MPVCVTLQAWVQARHGYPPSSTASQEINCTKALQVFPLIGSIITLEETSFFSYIDLLVFWFLCCVHTWACPGQRTNRGNCLRHGS